MNSGNTVREAGQLGRISKKRAERIAASLLAIEKEYGADILGKAFWITDEKAKKGKFNFTADDPTRYVRTVAKGLWDEAHPEDSLIEYGNMRDRFSR